MTGQRVRVDRDGGQTGAKTHPRSDGLTAALVRRIRQSGPITLADYMAACLLDPTQGYYTRSEVFGAAGDFITAPEISQMFGEILGLALAQSWLDQGAPAPFVLAELGPGRGTLMADILRAVARVPGFRDAARVVMVEASPRLRGVQAAALHPHPACWVDRAEDLPEGPLWLVANEFFDALPIRQFLREGAGWSETVVGLAADGATLMAGRAPVSAVLDLAHRLAETPPGAVVEICPSAVSILGAIALRIATARQGLALVVDYGDWAGTGDTFQALRRHAPVDPLAQPGLADLTAHVDFAALAGAARAAGARVCGPIGQGKYLGRLGIGLRAEVLARGLQGDARDRHMAAFHRLTDPAEMGTLFKVLAITAGSAPRPPGFDPTDDRP
jgi:NADH dehydrogenase [ubiquinone] 1 alpha subcomplex assembly factor 7